MAPKRKLFRCQLCPRILKSALLLKNHVNKVHNFNNVRRHQITKGAKSKSKHIKSIQKKKSADRSSSPEKRAEFVKVFCVEENDERPSERPSQEITPQIESEREREPKGVVSFKQAEGYITFRCSACNMSYRQLRNLIRHIEVVHRDGLVSLFLPSVEVFKHWLKRIQVQINASYELLLQTDKKDYYLCSMYISDENPWDYLQCPSMLISREYSRGVQVFYHPIHFQHIAFTYNPYVDDSINKYIVKVHDAVTQEPKADKVMHEKFEEMLNFISKHYKKISYAQLVELYALVKKVSTTLKMNIESNGIAMAECELINKSVLAADQKEKLLDNEVNSLLRNALQGNIESSNVECENNVTYDIEILQSEDEDAETIIPDSIYKHFRSRRNIVIPTPQANNQNNNPQVNNQNNNPQVNQNNNPQVNNPQVSNMTDHVTTNNKDNDDTDIEEQILKLKSDGKKNKDLEEILEKESSSVMNETSHDMVSDEEGPEPRFTNFNDTYKSFIESELTKRKHIGARVAKRTNCDNLINENTQQANTQQANTQQANTKQVLLPRVTKVWSEYKKNEEPPNTSQNSSVTTPTIEVAPLNMNPIMVVPIPSLEIGPLNAYTQTPKVPIRPLSTQLPKVGIPRLKMLVSSQKPTNTMQASTIPFRVTSGPKATTQTFEKYEVREQENGCNILILKI